MPGWRSHFYIAAIAIALYLLYSNTSSYESRFGSTKKSSEDLAEAHDAALEGSPKLASNSYLEMRFPRINREQIGTENATLVMLARNLDLEGALKSMRLLEDRFNRHYRYPWVFMNEVPFDDDFIEHTSLMASGKTYYELIPDEDWEPPEFIDENKLQQNLRTAEANGVIYGGVRSYRNMCHFNSGHFYKQKKLLEFEWYFRVEPDVEYMCDFQYDPFTMLRKNGKKYGFVITIQDYENTIPTLWDTVEGFMKEYPQYLHPNNALNFITSHETSLNLGMPLIGQKKYNLCHFWSNFEIGNLDFFRSEAYEAYFDYLDKAGGFYYERWGDAPVHTIGLSLLLDKNEIHHFDDIGYYHPPYMACPASVDIRASKRCICQARDIEDKMSRVSIDVDYYSCLSRWWRYGSGKRFLNEIDYTAAN